MIDAAGSAGRAPHVALEAKFAAAHIQQAALADAARAWLLDGADAAGLICWPFVASGVRDCGCGGRKAHLYDEPAQVLVREKLGGSFYATRNHCVCGP